MEKRLGGDSHLKTQYSQFINEYIALGHMKAINETTDEGSDSFYLPHHCVFKFTQGSNKI